MKFEKLYSDNSDNGNKHFTEPLKEILGSKYRDFHQESEDFFENYADFYNSTFESSLGCIKGKPKMKVQKQPEQPVKQIKKPKKGKGIIKVIAGVGAVVLCATIISWIVNSEEMPENTEKPIIPVSPYFSYGMNDNEQVQDSNNFTR